MPKTMKKRFHVIATHDLTHDLTVEGRNGPNTYRSVTVPSGTHGFVDATIHDLDPQGELEELDVTWDLVVMGPRRDPGLDRRGDRRRVSLSTKLPFDPWGIHLQHVETDTEYSERAQVGRLANAVAAVLGWMPGHDGVMVTKDDEPEIEELRQAALPWFPNMEDSFPTVDEDGNTIPGTGGVPLDDVAAEPGGHLAAACDEETERLAREAGSDE